MTTAIMIVNELIIMIVNELIMQFHDEKRSDCS